MEARDIARATRCRDGAFDQAVALIEIEQVDVKMNATVKSRVKRGDVMREKERTDALLFSGSLERIDRSLLARKAVKKLSSGWN